MKSQVRNLLSALFLVALAVAIVWGFSAFGSRGSLLTSAASTPISPLATPTTLSPTATPTPAVIPNPFFGTEPYIPDRSGPGDPMPKPSPRAAPTPAPTPIDWSKPTGGPYISDEQAISTAMSIAEVDGEVDRGFTPRAVFTTASGVDKVTEYPRPRQVNNQREVWVIEIAGNFPIPSKPPHAPMIYVPKLFITIDATSGIAAAVAYREY